MDLTATILAAARVRPPKERPLDGMNLLPILADEHKEVERTFYWRIDRSGRKQKAVRHGRWKYVQDGMVEMLFDLEQDIGERATWPTGSQRRWRSSSACSPAGRRTWPAVRPHFSSTEAAGIGREPSTPSAIGDLRGMEVQMAKLLSTIIGPQGLTVCQEILCQHGRC